MAKILYSSAEIRRAIVRLFKTSKGRRVAISAFVGIGAKAYLPMPKGLELICWPKEPGTNPDALRDLSERGVKIMFADSMHMKIYWTESQGAIITSANLSDNALGSGGLKEIGVMFGSDELNIDGIIESIDPRPLTESELNALELRRRKYLKNNHQTTLGKRKMKSYNEWFEASLRPPPWKLGWYDSTGKPAEEARIKAKEEWGKTSLEDFLSSRKGDYKEDEWILKFSIEKPARVSWLYAHYIVNVHSYEKGIYSKEFPYQVAQVWPLKSYEPPPFRIDKRFKIGFAKAVQEFGSNKIKNMGSCVPPKQFLCLIKENLDLAA